MTSTMQLLEKALTVKKASHWANDLNLSNATFTMASKRGRLSPTLAGNIAIQLGENPEHWMAVAALEAEPESPLKAMLQKTFEKVKNLYFPTLFNGPSTLVVQILGTRITDTTNSTPRRAISNAPIGSTFRNRVPAFEVHRD